MSQSNAPDPSPEEMAQYRASARRRAEQRRQQQLARYHWGRQVAEQAAQYLKETWGAGQVVLTNVVESLYKEISWSMPSIIAKSI